MEHLPFSVSMSVYGKDDPNHFETAVNSILNQTLPPDEVVLVVDGPVPPALEEKIATFERDPRFSLIRLPENGGLGNARRLANDAATHEIIALMDSDDISVPDRFEVQMRLMTADPTIAALGGDITEFLDGDEKKPISLRAVPTTDGEIKADMKKRCAMNHPTVMYRRSAVVAAGNYQDWYYDEDYYLWVRMWERGLRFANTGTVLVHSRVGADMYRRRGGLRYFRSEARLQKYMRRKRLIGPLTYFVNVMKRLIVQVLMPSGIRSFVFCHFARKKPKTEA